MINWITAKEYEDITYKKVQWRRSDCLQSP